MVRQVCTITLAFVMALCVTPMSGAVILSSDIFATTGHELGSGNGTLNLVLLTESSGGTMNEGGGFNGDNANTAMPTGSGKPTANGSYITSIGELRDFYRLNFPDGQGGSTVHRLGVFVDLNQVTNGTDVQLQVFTVVIDFTPSFGDARDNPFANDITSSLQNETRDGFAGGSIASHLASPVTMPLNVQGAGWADYIIDTKVDPFDPAYMDGTRILIHWESAGHTDGGETIFLSGTFAIPEPATLVLLAVSGLWIIRRRRVRYVSD